MKNFTNKLMIPALFLMLVGFSTCKNKDVDFDTFKIERERVLPEVESVTITGSYSYIGEVRGMAINIGEKESLTDALTYDMLLEGTDFSVKVEGLKPSTKYYYRYTVDLGGNETLLTETENFTTLDAPTEEPMVKTLEWLEMDSTTYRIKCQVVADGGSEVTERGICWNTYGDPIPYDDSTKRYEGNVGIFDEYSVRMEHLALGEKYYVRAYAKNAAGKIGYSEEPLVFETNASAGMPVEIELSCNPEEGGTVSGGGSYEVGTQCTVTAEANAGYSFVNWTENGSQVSSTTSYTFPVTASRSLVANFTSVSNIIISTSVTPDGSGTTTGAGGYIYGATCTLTATPNSGYDFEKWTKNGNTVSTNAEYSFTVTETANYVAHFKIKSYTILVSANPTNGGTVSGGGTFNHGQSCTVQATPTAGFAFDHWTDDDDVVSTEPNYTFTVSSNRHLVAHFSMLQPDEFFIQVSANPSEGGTVEGGGTYQQGQSCKVKATSKPGFNFKNWTENGNQVYDLAEYTFTVEGNRTLVANFEAEAPVEYTINVSANPEEGGTVTGGGTYQPGQQCNVTATANEGYIFTNWTENDMEISTNSSLTFIVNNDRTLVANFTKKSYTIEVSANPSNGGTVSGGGTYYHGQSCTVIATAASGYSFSNWTENDSVVSNDPNYTFTVTGPQTLVANFEVQAPNTYTINVSPNPIEGGTVTGSGTYQQGESCTVTATAKPGYTFLRWTENGNEVSTNTSYTFTVTGDRTLVAQFQANNYTINVSASNGGTAWVGNGGNSGTYQYNQNCTVHATANNGYHFVRWTENGNPVSTNANYTFQVTSNRSLVAQFEANTYTINVSASNGGTAWVGNGGSSGTYQYNQNCTVHANANSGYTFVRWTENGQEVSTSANYTFQVTSNRFLVAQFQANTYTINVLANPTNGGTVWVGNGGTSGTYSQGSYCTVHATPAAGYTFLQWTINGSPQSNDPDYTFTVTGNQTLTAHFQPNTYTIVVSANPSDGGTVWVNDGGTSGTFPQGTSCTIHATANSGFVFDRWTENGTVVSTNANYTFQVNSNRTLVAQFVRIYTINVSASPTTGGSVSGGGTYQEGQSCTVTAYPNSGSIFLRWTENGNQVSTEANYQFTVTSNRTLVAHFQQCPNGAIDGKFTVNGNGQQVYFSKGNLQYIGSAGNGNVNQNNMGAYWKFADHQWDYLGDNGQGGDGITVDRDLFGWGTSGIDDYNPRATCWQPWRIEPNNNQYNPYSLLTTDLYDYSGKADWGYNNISYGNGTTPENQWRTLTNAEWNHVFNNRQASTINGTPNARYAKAKVANTNGVILFPDTYTHPSGVPQPTNINNPNIQWNQSGNNYSSTQWSQMETNGAVFLPAAGRRGDANSGNSVYDAGANGLYWSSTHKDNSNSYMIRINNINMLLNDADYNRHNGLSVRLVCSPQ